MKKIEKDFFERPTREIAKNLLGKNLIRILNREKLIGKIVEVEAYLDETDTASHARFGITKRNTQMFMDPGNIYVYFIYGMYYCLNFVTEQKGKGSGILIRALEPLEGISTMQKNREKEAILDLTNGPGKLCKALSINLNLNGKSLFEEESEIYLTDNNEKFTISSSQRIGVKNDLKEHLRFFIKDNKFVSK